ncbi:MAG: rhodanese [Hyphomicrobium sp.]|nr:rhodanese [Hyphomicrobium sp.]PPC82851.1 MAG: rhodanese [Hyphomicrobium sp.]
MRRRWWLMVVIAAVAAGPVGVLADQAPTEPTDYKTTDYRSRVPATLAGALVLSADEAKALWDVKSAVFIDVYPRPPKPPNLPPATVWRDPRHASIEGAHWLPNVGYGVLSPEAQAYFSSRLAQLTGHDTARKLVFFCLRDCWMSWNAAKRAMTMGYTAVAWFPDGTDGWMDIGLDLVDATAVP